MKHELIANTLLLDCYWGWIIRSPCTFAWWQDRILWNIRTNYNYLCLVLETLPDIPIQHLTEEVSTVLYGDVVDDQGEIGVNVIESLCIPSPEFLPGAVVESERKNGLGWLKGRSSAPCDAIHLSGDSAGKHTSAALLKCYLLIRVYKHFGKSSIS